MQKQNRLQSSRSFDYIYKHGEAHKNRFLVLFVMKSKISEPKVGFSVGKKVGGSVQRNKTKRRLKEALRREFARLKRGYNYVVVARTGSADAGFDQLSAALFALLKEAGALTSRLGAAE